MVSSKLPAPFYICFFQFLHPPVECFRALSLLQAGSHLCVIVDPFPQRLIGRTDPLGFPAVWTFIIGVLNLPIPDRLPLRIWDHSTAFITDNLHIGLLLGMKKAPIHSTDALIPLRLLFTCFLRAPALSALPILQPSLPE